MAELKRPDNIPGYEHPTESQYSKNSMYKTFTEGAKKQKRQKFGVISSGKNNYKLYGDPVNIELNSESNKK